MNKPYLRRVANPPSPYDHAHLEWDDADGEPPPLAELEVLEEETKTALAKNDSPDVGFTWSLNPYRGCFHACGYCYARSSHQYLGLGAGTDFERKIVVKTNIASRLRETFDKKSWQGETIAFSGNTDCYQPLEASYELTRQCLALCLEYRNPVGIITKSALVKRDVALIAELARVARCTVTMSIAWADDDDAKRLEPTVTRPSARFEVMRLLHEAGVPVGVGLAPVIPGLNDMQIPRILERAREAGATHAFMTLIRLSGQTLPIFDERLEEAFPERAQKVRNAIREMRGGRMNDTRFEKRMAGAGARWKAIEQLFAMHVKRLGLDDGRERHADPPSTFRRPRAQLTLF